MLAVDALGFALNFVFGLAFAFGKGLPDPCGMGASISLALRGSKSAEPLASVDFADSLVFA